MGVQMGKNLGRGKSFSVPNIFHAYTYIESLESGSWIFPLHLSLERKKRSI